MSEKISVKIKRFDKELPLPEYKSQEAACFDLYVRVTTTIQPGEVGYVPLNIAIDMPKGYWAMLAPRGSTHKLKILQANSIGIGDSDFRGNNNEYHFPAYNFDSKPITIERGTRMAQMMILPVPKVKFTEVDQLTNPDRGSYGSTGYH